MSNDIANFMNHSHYAPCDGQCSIHGPNLPVKDDPWNLQRFIEAQDAADTFRQAILELKEGRKQTHWMWFVFPQIWGLGNSEMTNRFALRCIKEAEAYVTHPVLHERFENACAALTFSGHDNAELIFGKEDSHKLRSSLTLFSYVGIPFFTCDKLLDYFFDGVGDDLTLKLIAADVRRTSALTTRNAPQELDDVDENRIQLQRRKNDDIWLNLSCRLDSNGNFFIEGHDMGPDSEYEWQTVVRAESVPQLIALLGGTADTDLLEIIRRDWLPIEGDRLEKLIKLSTVPSEFSNYGTFP